MSNLSIDSPATTANNPAPHVDDHAPFRREFETHTLPLPSAPFSHSSLPKNTQNELPWADDMDALKRLFATLSRRRIFIAMSALFGMGLAFLVTLLIPTLYTTSASVLVDTRSRYIMQQQDVVGRMGTESAAIESEVEVLQSLALLERVVKTLGLEQDPEFSGMSPADSSVIDENARVLRVQNAIIKLQKMGRSKRVGLTYLIDVSMSSRSAQKAALIATTIAQTYLTQQMESKNEATRRANTWLNDRVEEQRKNLMKADEAVEAYKVAYNLIGNTASERLPERQIQQLNEELANARSRTSEALVKYEQLRNASRLGVQAAASFVEVQSSPMIQGLRTQAADLTRREAELLSRYGDKHPKLIQIRAELKDVRRQIQDEITRIVATARNELETARSRQEAYEANLAEVKNQSANSNQAGIRLKELEREAETTRVLFQSFLQRAKETSSQENLQQADARLVSAASVPQTISQPKRALMVAAGLIIGLVFGFGVAFAQEGFKVRLETAEDIESAFQSRYLTTIPYVTSNLLRAKTGIFENLTRLFTRTPSPSSNLSRYGVEHPHSQVAQAIRKLRFSLQALPAYAARTQRGCVIALTSVWEGEGKSTLAQNLAHYGAYQGERTLLMNIDLRPQSPLTPLTSTPLTSTPVSPASLPPVGLTDILCGKASWKEALQVDPQTGLHTIALQGQNTRDPFSAELLESPRFEQLLEQLRLHFQVIVMDTPALSSSWETHVMVAQCDTALLMVQSQQISREKLQNARRDISLLHNKVIGIVINGTQQTVLSDVPIYGQRVFKAPLRPPSRRLS
jgi:polysaccharide biosynthesis transport protein